MASNYEDITLLYEKAIRKVTSNISAWQEFLKCSGHNYKLPFDELLLVYEQKSSAKAVLPIEIWNRAFNRIVNRGSKGIAVFDKAIPDGRQRLKYYFDISDTHASEKLPEKSIPVWSMKPEYEKPVIEALENTFGELDSKEQFGAALMSVSEIITGDNLDDYMDDLGLNTDGSFLEELDKENLCVVYRQAVCVSVAYMLMERLGVKSEDYLELSDFVYVAEFNTKATAGALGVASFEIAKMVLDEAEKTIKALQREENKNSTFAAALERLYNQPKEKEERSENHEEYRIYDARRLQNTESGTSSSGKNDSWKIRKDAGEISEGTQKSNLYKSSDKLQVGTAPSGDRTDGSDEDAAANGRNERTGTDYGGDESKRSDELGTDDEQHQGSSRGNHSDGIDLQLEYYDRETDDSSLPFFSGDKTIRAMLRTTPHLKVGRDEIRKFYETNDNSEKRIEYIKSIFNNDYTELIIDDDRRVGYKTYQNVLHLWEGPYLSRTAQGYYEWGVISEFFDSLRIRKELYDERKPLPSMEEQVAFFDEVQAESPFVITQEIIDVELCRGSNFENGKFRIYEQFEKSLSAKENVNFLKKEYGTGGTSDIKIGLGISQDHSSKGIELSARYKDDNEKVLLKWPQIEKRIRELIHLDRYLNSKEKEMYPAWLEKRQRERTETQNVKDEVSKMFPTYSYSLGDTVYIGSTEYKILSLDGDTVRLYDFDCPLINKEMVRSEFEKKVGENPGNQHLIAEQKIQHETEIAEKAETDVEKVTREETDIIEDKVDDKEVPLESIIIDLTSQKEEDKEDLPAEEEITPSWEKRSPAKKSHVLCPFVKDADRINYKILNDELRHGSKKEKFAANLDAIKMLKFLESAGRLASEPEQKVLSGYVGWGGLSETFDEANSSWTEEYRKLKDILTEDEYERARESTLTAFYTPPVVIKSIYKALDQFGFRKGNILEPSCGTGNFMGFLPDKMDESRLYGVELDEISGRIAQQLYQKATIAVEGFEKTNLPDSFFDAAIGNVPFGDFKLADKRYDKHGFYIHDYFFAKTLDKVRAGGVICYITSKGTMDKANPAVRKYISQRAELLGAIRLPETTFTENAGTTVTADILFLQKRDKLMDMEADWVYIDSDEDGIAINRYFIDHPEMIIGRMIEKSGRFGMETACVLPDGADFQFRLLDAIERISGEIPEYEFEEKNEDIESIPADPNIRNFSYTDVNGKLYFRENSIMVSVSVSVTAENRIRKLIEIRESVRKLIELQTEDYSDGEIKKEQMHLNQLYDAFSKKYGLVNSRANNAAFSQDSSYFLLCALEVLDEEGNLKRKADMFIKRTIRAAVIEKHADTVSDALALSIAEKAKVDMAYMESVLGKSEEEIAKELSGVIFLEPEKYTQGEKVYQTADEYLAGNVRRKLSIARHLAKEEAVFLPNVEALEKVQPQDLSASEISVRLGATWIPEEYIRTFIFELLETPEYMKSQIDVKLFQATGEWNITGKSRDKTNIKAYSTYGTGRINAYKIIEYTLNLRDVKIFDYEVDREGRKIPVLNSKETAIARAKQEQIKEVFKEWIWKDVGRRQELTTLYNERFNSDRTREYDGKHIRFFGMNPEITLKPHQINAVARILYGGNTLLAHAVGAGKTFEMTAAAMESKRLGLCNKSLFVVPNHLTEQWAAEFLQLYPAANILVATRKDFEKKNRKKFCGRIATGDFDAVIIGHSQFESTTCC